MHSSEFSLSSSHSSHSQQPAKRLLEVEEEELDDDATLVTYTEDQETGWEGTVCTEEPDSDGTEAFSLHLSSSDYEQERSEEAWRLSGVDKEHNYTTSQQSGSIPSHAQKC